MVRLKNELNEYLIIGWDINSSNLCIYNYFNFSRLENIYACGTLINIFLLSLKGFKFFFFIKLHASFRLFDFSIMCFFFFFSFSSYYWKKEFRYFCFYDLYFCLSYLFCMLFFVFSSR